MAKYKKVKSINEKNRATAKVKKKAVSSVSDKKTASSEKKVLSVNAAPRLPSGRKMFFAGVVLISGLLLVWKNYIGPKYFSKQGQLQKSKEENVQSVSVPQIGGSFLLVNQDGETVSEADFMGKYMLVYFGFTYCPDVCPTSLTVIEDALGLLGDEAEHITPVFITVDPERDNPEALKLYVEHFHPRQVGLTGSVAQIKAVAKAYKVYFSKSGDGYDDDYLLDHSSITYLMSPEGKFITHFSNGVEASTMAEKITEILK